MLDAFRGIAALAVVALHALSNAGRADWLPSAHLAVDFFFGLSGFVLCHAYETRLRGGLSAAQFLCQRIVRLWPFAAIGVVLGLAVMAARLVVEGHPDLLWRTLPTAALNGLFLPSPFLPLGNASGWPLNLPLWSLTFELAANLVYALILVHTCRRPRLPGLDGARSSRLCRHGLACRNGGCGVAPA